MTYHCSHQDYTTDTVMYLYIHCYQEHGMKEQDIRDIIALCIFNTSVRQSKGFVVVEEGWFTK